MAKKSLAQTYSSVITVGGVEIPTDVVDRIEQYSTPEPNTGCWLWFGYVDKDGYGRLRFGYKDWLAHRLSFAIKNKYWPPVVRHKCDTPSCVNPDHLEGGTSLENRRDCCDRDRQTKGAKHWSAKLSEVEVKEIKLRFSRGETTVEISKIYGVCYSTISRIKRGLIWTHIKG